MLHIEQSARDTMSIVGDIVGESMSIMEDVVHAKSFVEEKLFIMEDVVHGKLHHGGICGGCSP